LRPSQGSEAGNSKEGNSQGLNPHTVGPIRSVPTHFQEPREAPRGLQEKSTGIQTKLGTSETKVRSWQLSKAYFKICTAVVQSVGMMLLSALCGSAQG